ncbi:MAG TPA: RNA polymerase sigma factor [Bdellovibrionota bacterium]|nr:RNA polymerase sigma factor [Bdellovibrionota bacterium]
MKRDEALTAAVEIHGERLLSVIQRRVRDRAEADDIYQEVFEEFVEAYDLGVVIETLGAWLARVAQNKILDRFRRRKTRKAHRDAVVAEAGSAEPTSAERPDEDLTRRLLRSEIAEALDMLPKEQREVFVKHELEGKSFEEIARETGVKVNTLLSRKRYAVNFLREHLKEIYDGLE